MNLCEILGGSLAIVLTPRGGGEPVTLLTVKASDPPARMSIPQWKEWTAADQERMVREMETWVGGLELVLHERTQRGSPS